MIDTHTSQDTINTVQPELSKQSNKVRTIFIGALLILLPVIGFIVGRQSQTPTIPNENESNFVEASPTPQPEIQEASHAMINQILNQRCGDMPSAFLESLPSGHFTVVSGPTWSPDCRYIGYGVWESGTSHPEMTSNKTPTGGNDFEGLFLYSDRTGKVERVYTPEIGETVKFISWDDASKAISFKKDGTTEFLYNLETRSVN